MVHADGCDDRDFRGYDVGGVQSTAQPNFDNTEFGFTFTEITKRHCSEVFKQSGGTGVRVAGISDMEWPHRIDQPGELVLRYGGTVEADAFAE